MPENQEKIPRSRINKRNPDFKPNPPTNPERPEMADDGRKIEISQPNSDTKPTSDGHVQRPEMAGNGRRIEISQPNSGTTPASDGHIQRPEMAGKSKFPNSSSASGPPSPRLPSLNPWPRPPETPA